MNRPNGFTLLEMMIVLLMISLVMGTMLAIYNISLTNFVIAKDENDLYQNIFNGMYKIENEIRTAEEATLITGQHLLLRSGGNTINFFLQPGATSYQLWYSRWSETSSASYVLCNNVVSGNTVFSLNKPVVSLTLNAYTPTNNSFSEPYAVTLSSTIRMRNWNYGQQ
ncbi:MAG: prepilin-type N-terminal cleavage/methylation domain-containing protein [Candidatus Margulisiibacteriota bacterium]|jgi:prepilin-type N-terminal cleavage/methylation domain-containing protein